MRKIAINCRLWIPGKLEGIGYFLQEITTRWMQSHPDCEFHLFFDQPTSLSFTQYPHVHVHVMYPPARHPLLYRIWFNWRVVQRLKRIKADLFFSPEALCPLGGRTPMVISVHDLAYLHFPSTFDDANLKYLKKYMPFFIEKAQKIVTVSNFSKRDIAKHFPDSAHKVAVAHNGCRPIFRPLIEAQKQQFRRAHTDGREYFFYYGSLNARKNIVTLLHGFQKYKEKHQTSCQLVLGGRKGWKTEAMEQAYQQHPFRNDIHFTGYLKESDLSLWLAAASALTYISHFEGFGLPVLEAMQAGVPVITSRDTSMEEIAGPAAYYVAPHSANEVASAMNEIHRQPEKTEEKVKWGLNRASTFSWDSTAEKIWKVLH